MSKKVAQIIVETLQSAGVKNCYGIVGDTLNTFATSLSHSEIKFVTCAMRRRVPMRHRPKRF